MNQDTEDAIERLLRLTKVLERYEYYLLRRSLGNFYIGIISIVATTIFLLIQMTQVLNIKNPYIYMLLFIVMITLIIALKVSLFKFRIFTKKPKEEKKYSYFWTAIMGLFVVLILIDVSGLISLPDTFFATALPILLGIGYVCSYYVSKRTEYYPGKVEKEYLVVGITFILTGILIMPFDINVQWFVDSIVLWLGMIILGVYLSSTAPRVFEE